jgi:hypothetical protein
MTGENCAPPSFSPPERERRVLDFWNDIPDVQKMTFGLSPPPRDRSMPSRLVRFQYASNIYRMQASLQSSFRPSAPYLAFAGNLGTPFQWRQFLDWAAPCWKRVFFTVGPCDLAVHDGTKSMHAIQSQEAELSRLAHCYPNVHFLHSRQPSVFLEDENTTVMGCTLWPYAKEPSPGFQDNNWMHAEHRWILEDEIDRWGSRGANICVITHYSPGLDAAHTDNVRSAHIFQYPVRLWIYGSHLGSSTVTVGRHNGLEKPFLCCANGGGQGVTGFLPDAFMEFERDEPEFIEDRIKRKQSILEWAAKENH